MKKLAALSVVVVLATWGGTKYLGAREAIRHSVQSDAHPQTDEYGGLMQLTCANKTGHFTLTKIDNRWWFCTPAGHRFISMNVGNVMPAAKGMLDCEGHNAYDVLVKKYGDATYNWGAQTLKRMTAWGFNSVGQDSYAIVSPGYPCHNCPWPGGSIPIKVPYIVESKPISYASVNLRGFASGYLKDIMNGVNNRYTAYRAMLPDVFDPSLGEWWGKALAEHLVPGVAENSPWLLGVFTDDSDYFWGSGAGTDFPSFTAGHNNPDMAYLVMISSPTQTYKQSTQYGAKNIVYKDTKNYSKADASNPTKPCSLTEPCSLRDYLWQKYAGNISALNRAWGSNYTTFDSTGKQVTGETIGKGDGANTTFRYKLAHTPISPNSVLVMEGNEAVAGDCAWFHPICRAGSGSGSLGTATGGPVAQYSSSVDYSNGAIIITFQKAPANGASITVNYIDGGWMAGGSGLMDESGSGRWMGSNSFCLEKSSSAYTVCVQGKEGAPNADPQAGADLDNWISQISAEYFKTMHAGLAQHSSIPYLGLDTIGSWGTPSSQYFLKGAAPYINAAFVQLYADEPSAAQASAMYSYVTRYLGDVPLMDFITLVAQPDSAESCHRTEFTLSTQQQRGQEYLATVQKFLNSPGENGDYPWVGFDWWAWQDFQNANQGLVSTHDNAYDGKDAVIGTGKDQWGFATGGESANYGDCLSYVERANALWHEPKP